MSSILNCQLSRSKLNSIFHDTPKYSMDSSRRLKYNTFVLNQLADFFDVFLRAMETQCNLPVTFIYWILGKSVSNDNRFKFRLEAKILDFSESALVRFIFAFMYISPKHFKSPLVLPLTLLLSIVKS